jgi:hypothetical protein
MLGAASPSLAQPDPWSALRVTELRGNPALGQTIVVTVDKLSEWAAVAGNDPGKLVLVLNGRAFKDLPAKAVNVSRNELQFDIRHTADTREAWALLLGKPDGFQRDMLLSVGTDKGVVVPGEPLKVRFLLVDRLLFWVFVGVLVVAGGLFLWLAKSSNILRDSGPEPGAGERRTYSLARTQMAIWFFLIVASYVVIWLLTSTGDSVTATVLGLMGISAGTALGAAVVDASRPAAPGTLAPAEPGPAQRSKGFLKDILNGPEGVSLHRFQMLIWTIVLGIMFVASVYNSLAMPEFSATLLGLMGISAGTYLGFKIPEKT